MAPPAHRALFLSTRGRLAHPVMICATGSRPLAAAGIGSGACGCYALARSSFLACRDAFCPPSSRKWSMLIETCFCPKKQASYNRNPQKVPTCS